MKYLIGFLCIILVSQAVLYAYAYEEMYEAHGSRFTFTPTVCTIEPDPKKDNYLNPNNIELILKETEIAISEWEVQLKNRVIYRDNKPNWEINYILIPLNQQKNYDYSKCNVFILFEEKPKDKNAWYATIGESQYEANNTGRTNIIVYYAGITFCVTQDPNYYYYNPCYSDKPRTPDQLANVVRHEFGHALGLGHYISDDDNINLRWARGEAAAPSIMAIFSHEVQSENIIHPIDIDKAYSLYGEDGFIRNMTKPFLGFEYFTTIPDKYVKDRSQNNFVKIVGNLTGELFRPGQSVDFTLTKPNKEQAKFSAKLTPDAKFEALYPINSEAMEGKYLLNANYMSYSSNEITFEILPINEQPNKSTQKIPTWIKNNARWWSENVIGDNDFVEGLKFLIKENIIKIEPVQKTGTDSTRIIPNWIKTTTGWWANDKVPEEDFISGIKYLIQEGIINLK